MSMEETNAGITDDLRERLVRLEVRVEEDRKNGQRRIAAYASLVALLISISTGSISLYNAFFVSPELERNSHAQRLSAALREYNARSTEAGSLPVSAPYEQRFAAQNGLNVARTTLVAEIRASDLKVRSRLSSPDLSASAWVIADNGEFGLSQEVAELAVRKATGLLEWASAMNTLARTVLISDATEGRALYDDLFSRVTADASPLRSNIYAVAASTEAQVLAATGRCDELAVRVRAHIDSLRGINADQSSQRLFLSMAEASGTVCLGN